MADEKGIIDAKSLVAKLAEAMDKVGGVEKKGRNETQRYDYVKAADVAKAIRHELFQRGIMLFQSETACEYIEVPTNSGGKMTECRLTITYELTDGTNSITKTAYGVARDSGDKAIYKAKTGAMKYFLRGLGLVPDEKDDPEADESVDKAFVDKKAERSFKKDFEKRTVDQARKITPAEAHVFWAAVKKGGKTEEQVKARFKSLKIVGTGDMMHTDYEAELKWAAGVETDYTDTLKKSVANVEAPESDKHNFAKLFAKAKERGIPDSDVKQVGYESYKVKSLNELTPLQFTALLEWVESQEAS